MNYTTKIAKETTDPKILTDILREENWTGVSWYAVRNENCPKEILTEILKRKKNDRISQYAVDNPNCPKNARKEWEKLIKLIREASNTLCSVENELCTKRKLIKLQKIIEKTLKNIKE